MSKVWCFFYGFPYLTQLFLQGWVGGQLDQLPIMQTQPSFAGVWAELCNCGKNFLVKYSWYIHDRFKKLYCKTSLIDSWRIQRIFVKIVLQKIPDTFVTDSKMLGKIVLQNIPNRFATELKKFGVKSYYNIPGRFVTDSTNLWQKITQKWFGQKYWQPLFLWNSPSQFF